MFAAHLRGGEPSVQQGAGTVTWSAGQLHDWWLNSGAPSLARCLAADRVV